MKINDIEIVDNYISKEDHASICDTLTSRYASDSRAKPFDWHYSPHKVSDGDDSDQFNHMFYIGVHVSDSFNIISPLLQGVQVLAIHRIKANLEINKNKRIYSGFHYDWSDNKGNPTDNMNVGIYYVNSNNGYTELEDGTIIDSVENRMVFFPSNIKHRGVSQTDTKVRCVINFNFFG
tara:strand:+ start:74 stop:607 length:534 start_codon:yes stop_codon:yes gene_type:complete